MTDGKSKFAQITRVEICYEGSKPKNLQITKTKTKKNIYGLKTENDLKIIIQTWVPQFWPFGSTLHVYTNSGPHVTHHFYNFLIKVPIKDSMTPIVIH